MKIERTAFLGLIKEAVEVTYPDQVQILDLEGDLLFEKLTKKIDIRKAKEGSRADIGAGPEEWKQVIEIVSIMWSTYKAISSIYDLSIINAHSEGDADTSGKTEEWAEKWNKNLIEGKIDPEKAKLITNKCIDAFLEIIKTLI